MRRRRTPRSSLAPSLFPFLAVLICTMGALIALLVLGVQQAHVHAEVIAEHREVLSQQQLEVVAEKRLQAEDLRWQQDVLEEQRTAKMAEFSERRLQLSHLEKHLRELQDDWERTQQKTRDLKTLREQRADQSRDWQARLQQLSEQIQDVEEQLVELRSQAEKASRGYAIVVYDGNQGTRRQPIYLECTGSGIWIHPGGIKLTREDLDGPGGPGNPLDACLRTIREYLVQNGVKQKEPYPLLLVRPDAVYTYAMAREAMKSWQDEFGYELIEEGVPLQFSSPDENLKVLLLQTIKEARQRQVSLSRAMPSRFNDREKGQYRLTNSQRSAAEAPGATDSISGRGFGTGTSGGAGRNPAYQQGTSSQESQYFKDTHQSVEQQELDASAAQVPGAGGGEGGSALPSRQRKPGWGLPKRQMGAIGISRPVRVICTTDRLIIVPGRYERLAPFTTQTQGDVVDSLDSFVASLWSYMENWGIAVAGGYWKPILKVEVRPGADNHFKTLKQLLESSGIEVQRK
ncbi:MAG: hypothetical protein VB877_16650 [Pirellulaceae bacterium]